MVEPHTLTLLPSYRRFKFVSVGLLPYPTCFAPAALTLFAAGFPGHFCTAPQLTFAGVDSPNVNIPPTLIDPLLPVLLLYYCLVGRWRRWTFETAGTLPTFTLGGFTPHHVTTVHFTVWQNYLCCHRSLRRAGFVPVPAYQQVAWLFPYPLPDRATSSPPAFAQ